MHAKQAQNEYATRYNQRARDKHFSECEKLLHLNDQQRDELLAVLDDHSVCFRDKPGLYTGAVHCIETTSEFKAKTMLDHCVPETVKPETDVEIQVETLNLFSELQSPYVNCNSRMLLLQQSDLCYTRTFV